MQRAMLAVAALLVCIGGGTMYRQAPLREPSPPTAHETDEVSGKVLTRHDDGAYRVWTRSCAGGEGQDATPEEKAGLLRSGK